MTVDESGGAGPGPAAGGDEIRDTVRELTAQVLRGERVDREGVGEVVRRMTGAATVVSESPVPEPTSPQERQALLDDLAALDRSLTESAEAAHAALVQITSRGMDFTDNDLKEAFARLRDLQRAYVNTVGRVADAASGNVERELRGLAGQAQRVGVDASARVAGLMSEFANRLNATTRSTASSGFEAAIDYGMRMSSLASGVLAGIADGLREHAGTERGDESAG